MASEWRELPLGDVVEVKHGWPFKSELFSDDLSGRPIVVNIGNFRYTGGFRFESTTLREYRGDYPREYELSPGEILLVMTCQTPGGEILGIPARVPRDGRIYLHNQRLGRVVVKSPGRAIEDYLYWLFLSPSFNRDLFLSASGTKILHTAPTRIEAVRVRLPSPIEQRAIAHILGTLDDKIELNRRMNETLEAMSRALFKSWFVDFDPARAKAEGRDPGLPKPLADLFPNSFADSELGEIPKGWGVSSVYDLATYINGAAYLAFEPNEERRGLPIIKIAELKAGVTAQTRFSAVDMPQKYRISTGDILFSWSGNPDTSIDIFVWTHGPAWLNQHIFRVVPSSAYEKAFVLLTLRSLRPVFAEIARNKQTTGLGHVTVADLKRLRTVRPPESVLLTWNTLVEPVIARSFDLQDESNALAALRDSLLPKLVSGELRVKSAERFAAGVGS